jgi:NADPH-dependent glutamate synthase beta subunit-like oxidoreductase
VPIEGSEFTLLADTAVKALGQQSRDELADWVDGLVFVRGQVDVDTDGRTGNPRFFCGGDAVSGGTSVVEAVRDGKRAAAAIDWELRCRS